MSKRPTPPPPRAVLLTWSIGPDRPAPDPIVTRIRPVAGHAATAVQWFADFMPVEGIGGPLRTRRGGGGWHNRQRGWRLMLDLWQQLQALGYTGPSGPAIDFGRPESSPEPIHARAVAALNELGAAVGALVEWFHRRNRNARKPLVVPADLWADLRAASAALTNAVAAVAAATAAPPEPPDPGCILWHGDRQYSIGDYGPVVLNETEHMALQAFLGDGVRLPPVEAMDQPTLCARSVEHAPRVLKKLREKHGGRFAAAITMPPDSKKGQGGYKVRIRRTL